MQDKINDFLESKDSIIIFDTNVYLNLYEYSPEVADFFINLINLTIEKIWLPKTVKIEFDQNHSTCFRRQKNKFENVKDILKKPTDQMKDKIGKQFSILKNFKFPSIDNLEEKVMNEINEIEEIFKEYVEEHDALKEINKKFLDEDKIKNLIIMLLDRDKLLNGFSIEEIYKLCEEGERRYKKKIPPGYKDEKDKSGVQMYDDFIIWKESIRLCKENNKNLIFVTDDVKEDWYEVDGNRKKRFRKELYEEFKNETTKDFIGITSIELYTVLAKKYEKEIPSTVEWALGYNVDRYVYDMVEWGICNDIFDLLIKTEEEYVDTTTLSDYDGTSFELSNELLDSKLMSYEFEGYYDGQANYIMEFDLTLEAYSRKYWGRDDDTREILLSPRRIHTLNGYISVRITRSIDSYLDELINNCSYDELKIVSGELQEKDSYSEEQLCVECRREIGDYQNYFGEPICHNCAEVNEEGDICTSCGRKVPYMYMTGDGVCKQCFEKYD